MRLYQRIRIAPRSCAVVCDQLSNARTAASAARCASSGPQSATSAKDSSVAGLVTVKRFFVSTHFPSMNALWNSVLVPTVSMPLSSTSRDGSKYDAVAGLPAPRTGPAQALANGGRGRERRGALRPAPEGAAPAPPHSGVREEE